MVPGIIGGGVNQINLTIQTILATLQAQAVGYLYYADRHQLPLAPIGSAIGAVLLPALTACGARQTRRRGDAHLQSGDRVRPSSSLPATVALLVVAGPIITVLYQRGVFTTDRPRSIALLRPPAHSPWVCRPMC